MNTCASWRTGAEPKEPRVPEEPDEPSEPREPKERKEPRVSEELEEPEDPQELEEPKELGEPYYLGNYISIYVIRNSVIFSWQTYPRKCCGREIHIMYPTGSTNDASFWENKLRQRNCVDRGDIFSVLLIA